MDSNLLRAIRGVLAFVSFTEFTTAGRCLIPGILPDERDRDGATYVQRELFNGLQFEDRNSSLAFCHVYGLYSALNGLVLIILSVFSHYTPLVFLGASSLILKLFFFIVQAAFFGTISGPNLAFPLVTSSFCILATVLIPFLTQNPSGKDVEQEILKTMKFPNRRNVKVNTKNL